MKAVIRPRANDDILRQYRVNPSRAATRLAMVLLPAPAGPSMATTTRFCFRSAKTVE